MLRGGGTGRNYYLFIKLSEEEERVVITIGLLIDKRRRNGS
jgi:hypothetical protein